MAFQEVGFTHANVTARDVRGYDATSARCEATYKRALLISGSYWPRKLAKVLADARAKDFMRSAWCLSGEMIEYRLQQTTTQRSKLCEPTL